MHHYLKQINDINDQISQLAEAVEWDEILALSNQRDQLLRKYFKISPLPDNNSVVTKIIIDMTNSDQEITEIIAKRKSVLVSESLSLKKSHQAINHYNSTQNHLTHTG